jgi:hypothetical protein
MAVVCFLVVTPCGLVGGCQCFGEHETSILRVDDVAVFFCDSLIPTRRSTKCVTHVRTSPWTTFMYYIITVCARSDHLVFWLRFDDLCTGAARLLDARYVISK